MQLTRAIEEQSERDVEEAHQRLARRRNLAKEALSKLQALQTQLGIVPVGPAPGGTQRSHQLPLAEQWRAEQRALNRTTATLIEDLGPDHASLERPVARRDTGIATVRAALHTYTGEALRWFE